MGDVERMRELLTEVKLMMQKGTEKITDYEWDKLYHAVLVELGEAEGEYEFYPD